jgi:ribosomal protein L11 methyltransferase
MYLWQRLASPSWWAANQEDVTAEGGNDLAVIERPDRKRLTIEIACRTRFRASELRQRFNGRVTKLPRNWLKHFSRSQKTKPLNVGKRLLITADTLSLLRSRPQGCSHLVIPAGAAFGTGQHATTAMSLRLLEELTRPWKPGWSMVDLGTGSGIFALSAKKLGAGDVVAIDNDPVAISTAKGNARLNGIAGINFQVGDAKAFRPSRDAEVVIANLFSQLLVQVLPKLRSVGWFILSGVMRDQERDVTTAVRRNGFVVVTVRRRGKWIAALTRTA